MVQIRIVPIGNHIASRQGMELFARIRRIKRYGLDGGRVPMESGFEVSGPIYSLLDYGSGCTLQLLFQHFPTCHDAHCSDKNVLKL